ncbi:MAG TPA: S41 family peptidase [Polyangiaceae bacterium]|nr:S41 family peptidase [Polyangiaceae bacterium]
MRTLIPKLPVVTALVLAAFGGGAFFGRFSFATSRDESPYNDFGQLGRVLVLVENQYVEPVDHRRVVEGAIKGMVRELDPHSAFMPPEDFRLFQSDTEGKFGGIGVEVDLRDEAITVIAPIEGSPAERAGIRSGDRVVAVDGQAARGEPLDKLVRKLRGAPGSKVQVSVRRAGSDAPLTFDLVREQIKVTSVVGRRLASDVLYLRLKQFQEGTHDELVATLAKLREQSSAPFTGILLDMRSNPGGLVDEASEIADEFLGSGLIYSTRHRSEVVEEVSARSGGALVAPPMAVLVNEYSASAAELVAGALQDNHRASIVGAPTFGKGSVQTILELPGGAGLKLTTMRYYTPSGHSIQAQGIQPDIVVESSRIANDPVRVTREQDLEGHLPAEGRAPANSAPVFKRPADKGTKAIDTESAPRTAADVPVNPVGSTDFALSIAYQIVRGVLAPKK